LRLEIGTYSRVFIVVDALNELSEHDQGYLITKLRNLTSTINLIVTSHPIPSIKDHVQGAKRTDIWAGEQDVQTYIEGRIRREPRLSVLVRTGQMLQERTVNKILLNAGGMYVFEIINESGSSL
jgi:hypothetical protein